MKHVLKSVTARLALTAATAGHDKIMTVLRSMKVTFGRAQTGMHEGMSCTTHALQGPLTEARYTKLLEAQGLETSGPGADGGDEISMPGSDMPCAILNAKTRKLILLKE